MIDMTVTRKINASIDEVWEILEDFGDLSWVPGASDVEAIGSGVGMTRLIRMPGLAPIEEKLLSLDPAAKTLSYAIPQHEIIPFANYVADIRLTAVKNDVTRVDWHCTFEEGLMPATSARDAIEHNYGMLLDSLEDAVAPSSCCGGCCG